MKPKTMKDFVRVAGDGEDVEISDYCVDVLEELGDKGCVDLRWFNEAADLENMGLVESEMYTWGIHEATITPKGQKVLDAINENKLDRT